MHIQSQIYKAWTARWSLLAFLFFAWLSGAFILHSSLQSQKKEQLRSVLQASQGMVFNQLQLLQRELGHQLSEVMDDEGADARSEVVMARKTPGFVAMGWVVEKDSKLSLQKFFKNSKESSLDSIWAEKQIQANEQVNPRDHHQALFWLVQKDNGQEYLLSLLPFEMGDQKIWGLGVSSLPTPWLDFSGLGSLFLLDQNSGRVLSAYGGKNQGGQTNLKLPAMSSYQVASFEVEAQEAMAWQSLKGSNLILVLKEHFPSTVASLGWWTLMGLFFLVGLMFIQKSKSLPTRFKEKEEEKEKVTFAPEVSSVRIEKEETFTVPSEILQEVDEVIQKNPSGLETSFESDVEDQLLETVLHQPVKGYRVAHGIQDVLSSLSAEVQARGAKVNVLVSDSVYSDWPQSQLRTVLEEVVRNSLEAMESSETKTLTFYAEEKDHLIELVVEDTGSGMTDEVLERALEAFFSTKPSLNKRRGLGLNVVKRLLEISGGSLRIESTPAVGTKIFLSFLREEQEASSINPPDPELNG